MIILISSLLKLIESNRGAMQSWNIAINEPYIALFLALHSMSPNRPHKILIFIIIHPWIVKNVEK